MYESVYKDYTYSKDTGILLKLNVIEKKHLLWREGGVPCIDKKLFDELQPKGVWIFTDKQRIFYCTHDDMVHAEEIEHGNYGKQYMLLKEKWVIKECKGKKEAVTLFREFEKKMKDVKLLNTQQAIDDFIKEHGKTVQERIAETEKDIPINRKEITRKMNIIKQRSGLFDKKIS